LDLDLCAPAWEEIEELGELVDDGSIDADRLWDMACDGDTEAMWDLLSEHLEDLPRSRSEARIEVLISPDPVRGRRLRLWMG
jgi:hypothetical protein